MSDWKLYLAGAGFLPRSTIQSNKNRLFPAGEDGSTLDDIKIGSASVDLRLGSEYYITGSSAPGKLTASDPYLVIPQGAFALLTTHERVDIPTNLIAFITMRYSFKADGLINVSGFHVDPGYAGQLSYSVYNAGPNDITVKHGDPIFTIFFAALAGPTEPYNGQFNGQTGLSAKLVSALAGSPVNLVRLEREVSDLRTQLRVTGAVALGLAVPIALFLLAEAF